MKGEDHMDNACIYSNKCIPHTIYPFAMLTDVDWQDTGFKFPKLQIRLRIIPLQPDIDPVLGGEYFNSIIHPTESAKYFYENFTKSFKARANQYNEAIGRIAMIKVEPSQYNGTKFSIVWYVYQKFGAGLQSLTYMQHYYERKQYPKWDARSWDDAPEGWTFEDEVPQR